MLQAVDQLLGHSAIDNEVSLEQYNAEIDAAKARIDAGEYTSQETVKRKMQEW